MVSTIPSKHKRSVSLHIAYWNSPSAHSNPILSTVNRYIPVQTSYHPYNIVYSVSRYLFEVIKRREDDLMAPSHQTHSSQKLQNQCFCPAPKKQWQPWIFGSSEGKKEEGQSRINTMNRLTLQVIYQTKPYPPSLSNICPSGWKALLCIHCMRIFKIMSWTLVCGFGFDLQLIFNIQTKSWLGQRHFCFENVC